MNTPALHLAFLAPVPPHCGRFVAHSEVKRANGLKQKDLAEVFGTASIVSEVLSGKRFPVNPWRIASNFPCALLFLPTQPARRMAGRPRTGEAVAGMATLPGTGPAWRWVLDGRSPPRRARKETDWPWASGWASAGLHQSWR